MTSGELKYRFLTPGSFLFDRRENFHARVN